MAAEFPGGSWSFSQDDIELSKPLAHTSTHPEGSDTLIVLCAQFWLSEVTTAPFRKAPEEGGPVDRTVSVVLPVICARRRAAINGAIAGVTSSRVITAMSFFGVTRPSLRRSAL